MRAGAQFNASRNERHARAIAGPAARTAAALVLHSRPPLTCCKPDHFMLSFLYHTLMFLSIFSAPIAQRTERKPPELEIGVRFLVGVRVWCGAELKIARSSRARDAVLFKKEACHPERHPPCAS